MQQLHDLKVSLVERVRDQPGLLAEEEAAEHPLIEHDGDLRDAGEGANLAQSALQFGERGQVQLHDDLHHAGDLRDEDRGVDLGDPLGEGADVALGAHHEVGEDIQSQEARMHRGDDPQ